MPNSTSRRRLISKELLDTAAQLFAERGFAATTLQDVADAMGISRPALYHYVRSKDELLVELTRDIVARWVRILEDTGARTDLPADQRLETALREIIVHNARNAARIRLLDRNELSLQAEITAANRQARHRILQLLTEMVEDGIAAGRLRPLPARTVALGMIGAANWVIWWYRPYSDDDPEQIADVLLDMLMGGVRRCAGREVEAGPWAALRLLQEDVSHLETTLTRVLGPALRPREEP
ncbi:TetR/AcrR family transcriptional regulator [Pseudonocardia kujensis]|uniref:TetR/AcrR family transcriptional regulator n=1 Tax=Pseudonocardia kujensis TaxID=1128675 RepID=UPI001E4C2488|nr:TetR/AcrR family transcriptional regulator [Pseudonocardia kujensis]MCE0767613.1 TetR/AcrR family transcriptional regulator [Pseudonocardia kujensis]